MSETRHGKYDECAARGMADTWRDSSAATVNLHEFIEHTIERGRQREEGRGEGGMLERNATHFPEEKRQLLFAICARWLYF